MKDSQSANPLSRTDRIGDLILSTPAIASVRASFPDAHITMVTSPYNRVVMERSTDIDELVDLPREVRGEAFGARFRGYDLAIALAPRATDLQLVGATRARVRVGYTYVRRWLARLTRAALRQPHDDQPGRSASCASAIRRASCRTRSISCSSSSGSPARASARAICGWTSHDDDRA